MSETLDTEPLASPDLSTPWVPLWPLTPAAQGELAYAQDTAGVTVTGTSEGAATTIVTTPAVACDGVTPLLLDFFAYALNSPAANSLTLFAFMDGASIGQVMFAQLPAGWTGPIRAARRYVPPAGSHTFSVRGAVGSGSVGMSAGPGGPGEASPLFLRVSLASPLALVSGGRAVSYATTLPASPVDGQEAILVDSVTNPSYQWRFRYNAGSTSPYKWEFVGGAPVFRTVAVQESTAVAGSWVNLATVGPSFTIPRAGDYDIEGQCSFQDTAVNDCYLGIGLGDHTSGAYVQLSIRTPADAAILNALSAFGVGTPASVGELRMKYYQSVAGTMYVSDRRLRVTPRRVS